MTIKYFSIALLVLPLFAYAQQPAAGVTKKDPEASALAPGAVADAAAELTLVTGRVTVSSAAGVRTLGGGDKVYVGDTLVVGANSYANLKFPDGGRVLLRPNTDFTVEAYRYTPVAVTAESAAPAPKGKASPAAPTQQAFFRLLRGGFRAVSGLIGKGDPQAYRVTTSDATIGIRGTDYEVQICTDDCPTNHLPAKADMGTVMVASQDLSGVQLAQAGDAGNSAAGGVTLATNEGTVVMQTGRGEYLVKTGEVAFALANGQVFMLPTVPDVLLNNPTPSPEDCN